MDSEVFYKDLLNSALSDIKKYRYDTIVFGELKTQTPDFDKNLKIFRKAQDDARENGYNVFDQVLYLDINLNNAPFDFSKKFPIFFEGIIKSGLIKNALFIDNWKSSPGSITEHDYCKHYGINIIYL